MSSPKVMGSTAGQWATIKPVAWQWWAEHTVETLLKCEQQDTYYSQIHWFGKPSRHYLTTQMTLSFSCCSLITWIGPLNWFCIMNEIIQKTMAHYKPIQQHHLTWMFSQLRHLYLKSANLVTVNYYPVEIMKHSPVAYFHWETSNGAKKNSEHTKPLVSWE